jgi:hypothetical protein
VQTHQLLYSNCVRKSKLGGNSFSRKMLSPMVGAPTGWDSARKSLRAEHHPTSRYPSVEGGAGPGGRRGREGRKEGEGRGGRRGKGGKEWGTEGGTKGEGGRGREGGEEQRGGGCCGVADRRKAQAFAAQTRKASSQRAAQRTRRPPPSVTHTARKNARVHKQAVGRQALPSEPNPHPAPKDGRWMWQEVGGCGAHKSPRHHHVRTPVLWARRSAMVQRAFANSSISPKLGRYCGMRVRVSQRSAAQRSAAQRSHTTACRGHTRTYHTASCPLSNRCRPHPTAARPVARPLSRASSRTPCAARNCTLHREACPRCMAAQHGVQEGAGPVLQDEGEELKAQCSRTNCLRGTHKHETPHPNPPPPPPPPPRHSTPTPSPPRSPARCRPHPTAARPVARPLSRATSRTPCAARNCTLSRDACHPWHGSSARGIRR